MSHRWSHRSHDMNLHPNPDDGNCDARVKEKGEDVGSF